MDSIIDRLAAVLRSLLGGGETRSSPPPGEASKQRFTDPDLAEAWEELEDYMNRGSGAAAKEDTNARRDGRRQARTPRRTPGESLRQDYANLEVPFGADIEEVRKAYRTLILRYHPDKHGGNTESQSVALEITKKINESFERIRAFSDGDT